MNRIWALVGAVWSFLRIALLFFVIIIDQAETDSPLKNLILLVFGAGAIGLITMYLELFRNPALFEALKNSLRWSWISLIILEITSIVLALLVAAQIGGLIFGFSPTMHSLILLGITVIGDIGQYLVLKIVKPNRLPTG